MVKTRSKNMANELEAMKTLVTHFRVVDLQEVLSHAKCNRSGRKAELYTKVINLIETRLPEIKDKLLEVHGKLPIRSYNPILEDFHNINLCSAEAPNKSIQDDCITTPIYNELMKKESQCIVRIKNLPFYEHLATLTPPQLLSQENAKSHSKTFSFFFKPDNVTTIRRDLINDQKIEVQMRFCVFDLSSDQEDCFPPRVSVLVNTKSCTLPSLVMRKKSDNFVVDPKPINIIRYVKLSADFENIVTVNWFNTDTFTKYVATINLVRQLSSEDLLYNLKNKKVLNANETKQLIKEKLKEDADCEIATTLLHVSLICPLGRMRIVTPVRASTCLHLQCFDALFFIKMNERNPSWNCPVCYNEARYENLIIDGYFEEVLASSDLPRNANKIELNADGSWTTHFNNHNLTKARENKNYINLDEFDINQNNIFVNGDDNKALRETVDLTVTDSDEDVSNIKPNGRKKFTKNRYKCATTNGPVIVLDTPTPSKKTAPKSNSIDSMVTKPKLKNLYYYFNN